MNQPLRHFAGFALCLCGSIGCAPVWGAEVTFVRRDNQVEIRIDGRPFATYVFRDARIRRPYLAHVHSPGGVQVTRNHPPLHGEPADHDTMHPGVWLAFGDLSGADFWRNKAVVRHAGFLESPDAKGSSGSFKVKNEYLAGDRPVCEEVCRVSVKAGQSGWLLVVDSRFSGSADFYFGDQEEMGLGVRVATSMAVKQGGRLTNSDALSGEKQVWGKQADWCDYSGTVDGHEVGILLAPDPANFGRSWFHARDYGFLAANPFGQRAFTKGEASQIKVTVGETLRLRFALVVHEGPGNPRDRYAEALSAMQAP